MLRLQSTRSLALGEALVHSRLCQPQRRGLLLGGGRWRLAAVPSGGPSPSSPANPDTSDDPAPPMPPGYVPVGHRPQDDPSLAFLNEHQDGGALYPYLDRGHTAVPVSQRSAHVHAELAAEAAPRAAHQRGEAWSEAIDDVQRRKTPLPGGTEAPLYDESGRKLLSREVSRGYRSVDGRRPLLPADRRGAEGETTAEGEEAAAPPGQQQQPPAPFDYGQFRRDLRALEYHQDGADYSTRVEQFWAKYPSQRPADPAGASSTGGPSTSTANPWGHTYTQQQRDSGLEGEPVDLAHASPRLQALADTDMMRFHPGVVASRAGLTTHQGYAFSPSLELGKVQRDVAEAMARELAGAERPKGVVERVTGLDPVQQKQVRLALADFDSRDTNTSLHVLHSYPFADNISVFIMCASMVALYQLQVYMDAAELYQEYLGIDIRVVPSFRRPLYCFIAFATSFTFLHQANLAAIVLTRTYRIWMHRPIGPP